MLHKLFHWLAIGGAVLGGSCGAVLAQKVTPSGWADYPNVSIRLRQGPDLPEGKRSLLIDLRLAPGWKTYWRMPGDAGIPPTFDWQGSQNLTSADVLYPAPIAMADQGGIAIGYKGEVSFPVVIVPTNSNAAVDVKLGFDLGVCKDVCIPVEAKLTTVVAGGHKGLVDEWSKFRARVPVVQDLNAARVSEPALLSVKGEITGNAPHIAFETKGATAIFAEAADGLFVPLAQQISEDKFKIDLSKSADAKDLVGKRLRLTIVGPKSAIETSWTWAKP